MTEENNDPANSNENNTNENNKTDVEFKEDQANGNLGDPSSKRNIGPKNNTQLGNQKDELRNLHISGNEVSGYGENVEGAGETDSGPGFEAEGSEFSNDHPVRDE